MGVSNKTPEFLQMNPIGKVSSLSAPLYLSLIKTLLSFHLISASSFLQVPVLETPDGPVFESNSIARYGKQCHV